MEEKEIIAENARQGYCLVHDRVIYEKLVDGRWHGLYTKKIEGNDEKFICYNPIRVDYKNNYPNKSKVFFTKGDNNYLYEVDYDGENEHKLKGEVVSHFKCINDDLFIHLYSGDIIEKYSLKDKYSIRLVNSSTNRIDFGFIYDNRLYYSEYYSVYSIPINLSYGEKKSENIYSASHCFLRGNYVYYEYNDSIYKYDLITKVNKKISPDTLYISSSIIMNDDNILLLKTGKTKATSKWILTDLNFNNIKELEYLKDTQEHQFYNGYIYFQDSNLNICRIKTPSLGISGEVYINDVNKKIISSKVNINNELKNIIGGWCLVDGSLKKI